MEGEKEVRSPRWGIGDAIGGLATSFAFSTLTAAVLATATAADTLDVWLLVPTIVAGWVGLVGWVCIASYAKGRRDLREDFGWRTERFDALRGAGSAVAALIVVFLFSALLDDHLGDPTFAAVEPQGSAEFLALGLCIVVGAPIVEELFFRGLFLRALARRLGGAGAVVVTSAVFALLHVPQRETLGFAQALLPLLAIGLALGWLAVRYGRLGPSIYAHVTINGIGFLGLMAS